MLMATDICLPVHKFSHAIGQSANDTIPWFHITAPDIFVLLKGQSNGVLLLQVVQGTAVLESAELGSYIDKARQTRRSVEEAGVTPSIEQLPIFGIAKENILALRYRLENHEPRRLQLRLHGPSDCQRLIGILAQRGLEFQEQRPRTGRPGTGNSGISASQARPSAADSTSGSAPPHHSQEGVYPVPHSESSTERLSQHPPSRGQLRQPARVALSNEEMGSQDTIRSAFDQGSHRGKHAQPSGMSSGDPYDLQRPTFGSSARTFMPPSTSQANTTMDTIRRQQSAIAVEPLSHDMNARENSLPSIRDARQLLPSSSDPVDPSAMSSGSPVTMSSGLLTHELPPRRELPFKRPNSCQNDGVASSSRPGSSTLNLPPLKRPNTSRGGTGQPPSTPSVLDLPTQSPLRTDQQPQAQINALSKLNQPVSRGKTKPNESRLSIIEGGSEGPIQPRPMGIAHAQGPRLTPMNELLFGKQSQISRSADPKYGASLDAAQHPSSPPATLNELWRATARGQSPSVLTRAQDPESEHRMHAAITAEADNRGLSSLREYATQNYEDRQAVLDEFMVQHLNDPAFTTLCADVENCWRRIALGL